MGLNRLQAWWRSYRYRFVPWLVRSGSARRDPHFRRIAGAHSEVSTARLAGFSSEAELHDHLCSQLTRYLQCLTNNLESNSGSGSLATRGSDCLSRVFGFSLRVGPSSLPGGDAGLGVFLTDGCAAAGTLVGLYPGTIYCPGDPALIPSLGNRFILRRADGLLLDAGDSRLGRALFRSCAGRDRLIGACDDWLEARRPSSLQLLPSNALATGHIVNNETADRLANVRYQELAWPLPHGPLRGEMLARVPCAFYSPEGCQRWLLASGRVPLVGLVSCRAVNAGEELLSSYVSLATG